MGVTCQGELPALRRGGDGTKQDTHGGQGQSCGPGGWAAAVLDAPTFFSTTFVSWESPVAPGPRHPPSVKAGSAPGRVIAKLPCYPSAQTEKRTVLRRLGL